MTKHVNLRVCASCEFIFEFRHRNSYDCPMCDFPSYGAHYVYGNKAYRYKKTQEPWRITRHHRFDDELDRKIMKYYAELL